MIFCSRFKCHSPLSLFNNGLCKTVLRLGFGSQLKMEHTDKSHGLDISV